MYRTGDLGLQLPSGDLVYLGRADTQVKVRGFRVECAEIEIAMMRLDDNAIRAAAVVAHRLDASIPCWLPISSVTANLPTRARSARRLRVVLPEYMIPDALVWLDEFPLTPSGKRDDKALRELPLSTHRRYSPIPPRATATSERSPTSWRSSRAGRIRRRHQLLRCRRHIDRRDAGGDGDRANWDVEIPLDAFVAAPTPAHLARMVAAGGAARTFDPIVALRSSGDRPPLFLVHPIGGNVLCYLDLVKHLPADQPVYALQAAGAEPGTMPLRTMQRPGRVLHRGDP